MAFYRTIENIETKKKLHRIENTSHKVISAELAINFNNNCVREKLCPKSVFRRGLARPSWTGVERTLRQRIKEAEDRLEKARRTYEELWTNFMEQEDDQIVARARQYLQNESERFRTITSCPLKKKK